MVVPCLLLEHDCTMLLFDFVLVNICGGEESSAPTIESAMAQEKSGRKFRCSQSSIAGLPAGRKEDGILLSDFSVRGKSKK